MRGAAKLLTWLGLSMLTLGSWPALALSCGGQMMQEHAALAGNNSHGEHGHHAASAGTTAPDAESAGECCDDCVMPCVSPGSLLLAPIAGSAAFEGRQAPGAPPAALPANPPMPVPFRPPIRHF